MHPRDVLQRVRGELDKWQATLDEVRLQAALGKLELRAKRAETLKALDESYRQAKGLLEGVRGGAEEEVSTLKRSLEAGWRELRRTYEEHSKRPPGGEEP